MGRGSCGVRSGAFGRVAMPAASAALGLTLLAGCGVWSDSAAGIAHRTAAAPTDTPDPSGNPQTDAAEGEPGGEAAGEPAADDAAAPYACDASDLLASLSTRQKLAQMLTVGVTGTSDAVSVVSNYDVGGIFIGSWTDTSMLTGGGTQQVEAADAAVPPLIAIDEEGGRVSRLSGIVADLPSARTMAQTMTVDEVYQTALDRGRTLRNLGITVDFAPDADVSDQPANSVIGDRSFSSDPDTAAQYAGAFARGLADAGVQPVIKHFPGHGHSSGDSHQGAVSVPPLSELQNVDLVPFRRIISEQPDVSVMVGHLDVPGLTDGVPASLSPAAMTLLRDGTGYDAPPFSGVIFTDDLSGMAAITDQYSVPQAVATALEAGADSALWLTTTEVPAVLDHLQQEVADGDLPMEQVNDSVRRVAKMKGLLDCSAG